MHAWRRLTTPNDKPSTGPGARTVIALSGGADSAALLIALASPHARPEFGSTLHGGPTLGPLQAAGGIAVHVVHDLRPRPKALADRDACRALCEALGVRLIEREVRVRESIRGVKEHRERGGETNVEAVARRLRYQALAEVALEVGAQFIATAHHLDDQCETVLMHLLRGASLQGLSGISPSRVLPASLHPPAPARASTDAHRAAEARGSLRLIRPLLLAQIDRAACETLCAAAGYRWAVDATNADTTRLRSALRHELLPVIRRLRPAGPRAVARAADSARDAERVVQKRTRAVFKNAQVKAPARPRRESSADASTLAFDRHVLAREPGIIIGGVLRRAVTQLLGSPTRSLDKLTRRSLEPIIRAITDAARQPRRFELSGFSAAERASADHGRENSCVVHISVRARVVELELSIGGQLGRESAALSATMNASSFIVGVKPLQQQDLNTAKQPPTSATVSAPASRADRRPQAKKTSTARALSRRHR